jgi:hypothetical protein
MVPFLPKQNRAGRTANRGTSRSARVVFLRGTGIPRAQALRIIDMCDVAPTLAHAANLPFSADGKK